jgi:hypothetical protein
MDIRVQSYSGHRGEETPRFLLTESRKIKVFGMIKKPGTGS